MSYYRLFQVDIIQTSQLYLGGGVNQPLPSSGLILYSDGSGGTFWSTSSGGTVSNATLISTVNGLGTAGYISSQQLLSTVQGLGNLYISTGTPGYGDVTTSQLISTTIGLGNIYLSTTDIGQVISSQLLSTTAGLGNYYISSGGIVSTVDGLARIGYISTQSLASTVAGLGQFYQSSPDVVLARNISVGISTNYLEVKNARVESEIVGALYASQIIASTSITAQDATVLLNYSEAPPTYPLSITGPTASALNFRMVSGSDSLTLTSDGAKNAILTSEESGVSRNPLILNASHIQATAASNVFTSTSLITPNNTQILASTISTGIVLAIQGSFSSLIADGSALYNLNAVSTATMNSTITGYAATLNVVSTATLASTVQGLPIYLGYLSTATLGPIVSTAQVTTSSAQVATQLRAASLFMSTTTGSSNLYVAVGAAATPAATIETSRDGITWSNVLSGGFSVQGNHIAWGGGRWAAAGTDATPANSLQYSADGQSWLAASGATFSSQANFVAYNGRLWIAVGQDSTPANTIKYSLDGITWSNSVGLGFSVAGRAVAWNGFLWVAVGQDSLAANSIQYSSDGITWQASAGGGNYATTQNTIAWGGSYWLAGGSVSAIGNGISYSKDGINWISASAPFEASVNELLWNGRVWIAAATDNSVTNIAYSFDGFTWIRGTGDTFSSGGQSVEWSGSRWIAGGSDTTQASLLKYSDNGIAWSNSTSNNFSNAVYGIAFSQNLVPFYTQENLAILTQNVPLFLTSTNTIFAGPSSLTINYTLAVDNTTNRVGINCNAPSYDLDIYGSANISSSVFASSFVGDGSMLTGLSYISTGNLISSLIGLGTFGYISSADFSSAALANFVSTSTLNQALASTTTNLIGRIQFTSSVFISTSLSTIVAQTLTVSTVFTSTLFASTGAFSSVLTSSLTSVTATLQQATVSSLKFFDGDGFVRFVDLQASNVSTIGLWASSLMANTVESSNLYLGFTQYQTPVQFYGLRGNYNNTVIAEQSTGTTSQELLFFKGSSVADQVRIQTTGAFRLETGVTSRLWPNAPQQAVPTLLIDATGNMNLDNGLLYADATNNRIGINCNAPGVALDVNGVIRGNGSLLFALPALSTPPLFLSTIEFFASTAIISTLIVDVESISSSVISSIVTSNISTNTEQVNQIVASSINTNAFFASTVSANTFFANTASFSTFITSSFSTTFMNADAITVSSLKFFDGDGFVQFVDLQASNVSTIGFWASSIEVNATHTTNLLLGGNQYQTPIQFYGLRGNYNNTVIAEQSTGISTQELLLFKGSSLADQIRLQTTGAFRVETGVSARLWPNAPQEASPIFLIDAAGNMTVNGGTLFADAANGRVGINCNVPTVALDVTGTARAQEAIFNSTTTSSLTGITAFFSTLTLSSIALLNASTVVSQFQQTNTVYASTASFTTLDVSTGFISSVLTVSSLSVTLATISSLAADAISTLYLSTGILVATETSMSTLRASTTIAADLTTQAFTLSSMKFYDGDGYMFVPDLQTSNISSIAIITSSITTNAILSLQSMSTQQIFTSSIVGRTLALNYSTALFTLDVNGNSRISSLVIDAGSGVTSTNTTFSLTVWGAGGAARVGGTAWTQISDQRIKENIVEADYDRCYNDIKSIPLRRFTYISSFFEKAPLRDKNVLGFIAQEVSTIQPKAVQVSEAFGIPDLFWLNIDQMNMALYGAVKKLMTMNESLISSMGAMESRMSTMEGMAAVGGNV
jgi:hypothetical protein